MNGPNSEALGQSVDAMPTLGGKPLAPLTARSVVASVLLGTEPPVMSARALVRSATLFGLAEGAVRTAMSRMVTKGELSRRTDGRYELAGHLVRRQSRQRASRTPSVSTWSGNWEMWVVHTTARSAPQRAELRRAARSLRLAELRDGVWIRPDNLDRSRLPDETAKLSTQARRFATQPDMDSDLPERLWDLDGWNESALELRRQMSTVHTRLDSDDPSALAPGFLLAAAVLRHLNDDPLLPREFLSRHWQGERLRSDYEAYDRAYSALLTRWLQQH
ncbi:MAG: PaaX family transcriptional regulator C-terminal domain-containing protein [Microthrixaceae bacterium]